MNGPIIIVVNNNREAEEVQRQLVEQIKRDRGRYPDGRAGCVALPAAH